VKKNQALKVPSGRMFLSFELDFAVREARLEWLFVHRAYFRPLRKYAVH